MPDSNIALSQLQEIARLVMHAAEADTLEKVLQRIADCARDLVKARYSALGVPDGEGGLLYFKVSGLDSKAISKIHHPPIGIGLLGEVMNERKSMRIPHMADHEKSSGFPEGHPAMDAFLGVPIQVSNQLFGMLYLTDREDGEPFSDHDQWLVETLAGYAALAIAGSQLREKQHKLTLLEERQRIGMELHDGIIQSLYALGMHIDLIRNNVKVPTKTFSPVIDGLNSVIEDIRTYIMDLRRFNDTKRTCRDMIEDVIHRLYVPNHIDIIVHAPLRPIPFDPSDGESVCMIVREAMSNAIRHANATRITVTARDMSDALQIVVHDDGVGFDGHLNSNSSGLGVRNMRQRAQLHGGSLDIQTSSEGGTSVIITIPTPDSEEDMPQRRTV